jgi:indolepyruvate ferredoxin oxidoreductase
VVFKVLHCLRRLRGTAFDPFGYSDERRMERRLIAEYRALVTRIVSRVNESSLPAAIELAAAAAQIGGYGPVKQQSVEAYESRLVTLLDAFEGATAVPGPGRAV